MKILIIEDNPMLKKRLEQTLRKFSIVEQSDLGVTGVALASKHHFDLIILDLNLPDMDGIEVCSEIRSTNKDIPILILTGNKDDKTQVNLLNAGADDFMTKPFNIDALVARINSLSRRRKRSEYEQLITVGDLTIDPTKRIVSRGETVIRLRRKEFNILEYLAQNTGRILSRDNIIDHAWSSTSAGWTGSVDVHIKKLRDAIDKPFGVNSVRTVYGVGYTLEPAFSSERIKATLAPDASMA